VVHEQFWNADARMADIVLPATTTRERDDIGSALRDPLLVAMKRVHAPWRKARDDHAIFASLAARLGVANAFWEAGALRLPDERVPVVMLEAFRQDPEANPLATPSGRIPPPRGRTSEAGHEGHAFAAG
jgi:biotin/methionine sulfoxide reductase